MRWTVRHVGTITFLIVVLGNQLVVSDSLSIVDTYVYVWCGWLLWLETLKACTSKLKSEACSLITNTKWWTIMLRLCSDVWSANCEQGISIYELWVELWKRNLVWKWCQNSLKRSKMESKYAAYEVKMSSLGACESVFETNNPAWCRQGGPKTVCPKFRSSFLGSFWTSFWKTFETQTASKDEVCFRCVSGLEI